MRTYSAAPFGGEGAVSDDLAVMVERC